MIFMLMLGVLEAPSVGPNRTNKKRDTDTMASLDRTAPMLLRFLKERKREGFTVLHQRWNQSLGARL